MNLPAKLEDSIREFARAAEAPNTLRAYRADFSIFALWCQNHRVEALPASPLSVCGFLTEQATSGVSVATIRRRVAAIGFVHRAAGKTSPIDDHVGRILRGIRRTLDSEVQAKQPLTADLIRRIVDAVPAGGNFARDRAVILLGFASAMRRSELAALRRSDCELRPEGLLIRIARSKTDQEAQGAVIAVARGESASYCPVEAWRAVPERADGMVFGICARTIGDIVKRYSRAVGLDASKIGAHSLRSGFITSAVMAGAPLFRVMEHSRHKSVQSAKRYFAVEKFKAHPGKGLL